VDLTAGASGGPFTGLTIASPPSRGTFVVHGLDVVYIPDAAATSAYTAAIKVVIANQDGSSAPITITITVTPSTQAISLLEGPSMWPPPL
jgi:hypothetical protein